MPLNPGNFLFPIQNLGPDIGKFFEGYNTQQKRGEEREKALAESAMARLKAERYPELLDAELGKLNSAEYGEFEKGIRDLEHIAATRGKDSDAYKMAEAFYKRKSEGPAGMELTVDPKTGMISYKAGGSRGAGGGAQIIDGKLITPPSQSTINRIQSQALANVERKYLSKQPQPYLGQGSNAAMAEDYATYLKTKDPKIGEKLVKAGVAKKIVAEYAALQLRAVGSEATKFNIAHQLESMKLGWPKALDYIVENLPPELQHKVDEEHAKTLEKLNYLSNEQSATGFPIELNEKIENERGSENYTDQEILEALGLGGQ